MSVRWYSIVVDSKDVAAQARWWAETLDWAVSYEDGDEVVIEPKHAEARREHGIPFDERGPEIIFITVPEGKTVKNRLHIDIAPEPGDDHELEVQRLIDRGATRVNIGQDESTVPWVVLADPEGNEFCVLSPRG